MQSALTALVTASILAGCASVQPDSRDAFIGTLKTMCGQRFEGALSYAVDPKNDFAGKPISTEVMCTESGVRMPVAVGEDRSRTWIITRPAGALELRHDHRHADGTPDLVTMYGGLANAGGSALSQSFSADALTAKMVPGSETNVWTLSLSADHQVLTYHLARHGKARAEFVLRRTSR